MGRGAIMLVAGAAIYIVGAFVWHYYMGAQLRDQLIGVGLFVGMTLVVMLLHFESQFRRAWKFFTKWGTRFVLLFWGILIFLGIVSAGLGNEVARQAWWDIWEGVWTSPGWGLVIAVMAIFVPLGLLSLLWNYLSGLKKQRNM